MFLRLVFLFAGFSALLLQAQPVNDTLRRTDAATAANVIGLSFTEPELDSLLFTLRTRRAEYRKLHGLDLPNSVPMSLWQSPLLPGRALPPAAPPVNWKLPKKVVLPANPADLAFYSLPELASLLRSRQISSVELTRFFLDRIKRYGDTLECVISVTEELAMEQARAADAELAAGRYRGLLHGIPYGLKDLFAVRGTRTTWGAAPYKEQVIEDDSYVYTKLKEAGAVLVAKFTLGSLAMGDWWYGGRTRNPWNLRAGSSGSSAGSAAATVAGLVPFAIGTETYGSIVSPSHTCGATGLRPTFGTISRSGAMTLSWSLDKVGPICRSATDAAVVYEVLRGTDGRDAGSVNPPFRYQPGGDIRRLRIGYAKNYFDRIRDTTANEWKVLRAFEQLGVTLVPLVFPDSGVYRFDMIGITIGAESAAAFDAMTRLDLDDQLTRQNRNDWPNFFRAARFIPAVEYVNTQRHRFLLQQELDAFFQQVDVLITPTYGGSQLAITNLTGHPALCLPTGFNRQQLPTSITLLAPLYGEGPLLQAGEALQRVTGWHKEHPALFR
ncbi:MAG TPA: amidase [Lacibacter sp.]|nr:amidase [Lacibacter sp.]HMO88342.1 amidase [Lacibacter sp.]